MTHRHGKCNSASFSTHHFVTGRHIAHHKLLSLQMPKNPITKDCRPPTPSHPWELFVRKDLLGGVLFLQKFKMVLDTQENEVKTSENIGRRASIPLSDCAKKLEPKVKKRYLEKISAIGIDPVLI